jgi:hypothetical protein
MPTEGRRYLNQGRGAQSASRWRCRPDKLGRYISRWRGLDPVPSPWTQPKKESGLESLIGVYGVRLLGAKMEIRLTSILD